MKDGEVLMKDPTGAILRKDGDCLTGREKVPLRALQWGVPP